MFEPAVTDAGPLLVTERSAEALTEVVTVAELLPEVLSVVVLLAVAVLLRVEPFATLLAIFATIVKLAAWPLTNVAIEQLTVPFAPTAGLVHVNAGPEFCASETNVVPAGSASASDAIEASAGPLFVMVSV